MGLFAALPLIDTIGNLAGVAALVATALLAMLTISQARDVRRLREWAGRAPERAAAAEQALLAYETGEHVAEYQPQPEYAQEEAVEAPVGAPVGAPITAEGPAMQSQRAREQWQIEAEAAALAELEARREERERSIYSTERPNPLGERSGLIVIVGGLILLFAIVFGAIQVFGGGGGGGTASESSNTSTQAPRKQGPASPGQVHVAVLNGTAVPGLAAQVGDDVRSGGFKLGAVTNSESSFDTTVVMYARGHEPEASSVAKQIGVGDVRLMTPEIQRIAKGAEVAVVVGQDRAPATTGTVSPAPASPTTSAPVTP
jgi:hypothetical protein